MVTGEQFREALEAGLGPSYSWAWDLASRCGRFMTFDIVNTLLHAIEQRKVGAVLDALEEHYRDHLAFQHPDVRGTVTDAGGYNPTQEVFRRICVEILGLDLSKPPVNA